MGRMQVETFVCPYSQQESTSAYAGCVWPKCLVQRDESERRPLCGNEVEMTRASILRRFAIKPRQQRKRKR